MNKIIYWIIPAIIIVGLVSFVFFSDNTPTFNNKIMIPTAGVECVNPNTAQTRVCP